MDATKKYGNYLIVKLDFEELYGLQDWRAIAIIEKTPTNSLERMIFYPLFGQKAGMSAAHDGAKVHNYRYKPYVDIDWMIQYESEENNFPEVSFLIQVRDYVNSTAESKLSKYI